MTIFYYNKLSYTKIFQIERKKNEKAYAKLSIRFYVTITFVLKKNYKHVLNFVNDYI